LLKGKVEASGVKLATVPHFAPQMTRTYIRTKADFHHEKPAFNYLCYDMSNIMTDTIRLRL
jgi:hypothetical protein